jgi:hypothetical protein
MGAGADSAGDRGPPGRRAPRESESGAVSCLRCAGVLLAGLVLGWAVACRPAPPAAPGQAPEPSVPEYKIKAGFLYNFVKLTAWPSNAFAAADAPLVVGVLGQDPFGPFLDEAMAGKSLHGHPLVVRRFARVGDAFPCHLLFVGRSESEQVPAVLAQLDGRSVLTVGETMGFARAGGMIGLVRRGEVVRFRVNAGAVARCGLKLSSKLLQLAERIEPASAGEGG